MGDHTDYAGGFVLPMAIAERAAVAMSSAPDGVHRIESLEVGRSEIAEPPLHFERRAAGAPDAWLNHPCGALRVVSEHLRDREGIAGPALRTVIASEVPIGAGVSSSAAIATALAVALLALLDRTIERRELVALLQRSERDFAGTPCGIMDMTVALAAVTGAALRIDCAEGALDAVPLPDELALLLIDSGIRHALGSSAYARRRTEVERATALLGSPLRADLVQASALDRLARAEPLLARRARHVITENARVDDAVAALRVGNIERLGTIALASHQSLRVDFEVTVPEVDRIVDWASTLGRSHGALGARMTGGGFGGSVIVFARRSESQALQTALREALACGSADAVRPVRRGHHYTWAIERGAT